MSMRHQAREYTRKKIRKESIYKQEESLWEENKKQKRVCHR